MSRRSNPRAPRRLRPGRCRIRHITRDAQPLSPPSVMVNGVDYHPTWSGLNGDTASGRGWTGGRIKPKPVNEPGEGTISLPNAAGSDGKLHRDRFAIITNGQATPLLGGGVLYSGGTYRPGDEWLEVYTEGRVTDPELIATPIAALVTPTRIELQVADAYWTLKKTREKSAGFWTHAPRDVIEHYMSNWQAVVANDLTDVSQFEGVARDGLQKTTADGKWDFQNADHGPVGLLDNSGFEVDLAGWTTGNDTLGSATFINTGAVMARVLTEHYRGLAAGRVISLAGTQYTGAAAAMTPAGGGFLNGRRYTAEVWLKGAVGGEQVQLGFGEASADAVFQIVTLSTAWQRFSLAWTPSANRARGYFAVRDHTLADSVTFYMDEARVFPGTVEAVPGSLYLGYGIGQSGRLSPAQGQPVGRLGDPYAAHRFEVEFAEINRFSNANDEFTLRLTSSYAGASLAYVKVLKDGRCLVYSSVLSAEINGQIKPTDITNLSTLKLAIETRDRWIAYYVNGRLVGCLPAFDGGATVRPQALVVTNGAVASVALRSFLWRRTRQFLAYGTTSGSFERGDARLAGAPPVGGLQAEYFNDADLSTATVADRRARRLVPTREPYARRLEQQASPLDRATPFDGIGTPPVGPPSNEFWSMRMHGSIYLDLENHDYTFSYNGNGRARIYIGRTRIGEEAGRWGMAEANVLPTGGMRAHLGTQVSGWYPILVEDMHDTAALDGGLAPFRLLCRTDGGADALVPTEQLSPIGLVVDQLTKESHFDIVERLLNDWSYQARCEPRQLESGDFPGKMLPFVRVGRDTDRRLSEDRASSIQTQINAEDVADTLLTDSQGLGGSDEGVQVTAEVINFAQVNAGHLFICDEYDQSPSITLPELAAQRADALLKLRSGPWQEVAAVPDGASEIADTLPLTGALSKFAWEPGDALALDLPTIAVVDQLPRGIDSVEWPIAPTGMGVPAVIFRQRRRDARAVLGQLARESRNAARYGQGQVVQVDGTFGATGGAASSLALQPGLRILKVWVEVWAKSDASSWNLQVNGATRLTVTRIGVYDITQWAVPNAPGTQERVFVALAGGTGTGDFQLHALVAITV